jgi:signal transduction histidine kinase
VAGYRDEQKRQLLAEVSRRLHRAVDDERRRVERDLHDGAQQHLITLALDALAAEASAPTELAELKHQLSRIASGLGEVSLELQEISRGVPSAILTKGGLPTALQKLARRSPVPVQLDVAITDALPEPIQIAAYYLVAEALTNAAKHADASTVEVHLDTDDTDTADRVLRVWVRDDGRGGADHRGGSGLVGLNDRLQTLGGRLWLHSPPGAGTTVRAELPLTQPPAPRRWLGCSCEPRPTNTDLLPASPPCATCAMRSPVSDRRSAQRGGCGHHCRSANAVGRE